LVNLFLKVSNALQDKHHKNLLMIIQLDFMVLLVFNNNQQRTNSIKLPFPTINNNQLCKVFNQILNFSMLMDYKFQQYIM